jgi:hypothetical protein
VKRGNGWHVGAANPVIHDTSEVIWHQGSGKKKYVLLSGMSQSVSVALLPKKRGLNVSNCPKL